MPTQYTYCLPPIDYGWSHLRTVAETVAAIFAGDDADSDGEEVAQGDVVSSKAVRAFLDWWELAKARLKSEGYWEGDFRGAPCVFWLPAEGDFEYGFVFKQSNNGTTFVVSPQPLPGLDKIAL